jgi:integrase
MDERAQGRVLADSTIDNICKPVRACFARAVAENQLRVNPADGLELPKRDRIEADDDEDERAQVRAFTREQLAAVLRIVHPRHRLLFELLASTGLRISESLGLYWRDLDLDSPRPVVRVRRQFYRGRFGPPKSRAGKRSVPIPAGLAAKLRQRRAQPEWTGPDDVVFANRVGSPLHVENLRRRHLRPVLGEAGAGWGGFHSFRHTFASMLIEANRPLTEVAALLGHSSPRLTLDTYSHWLRADEAEPLDLDHELEGGNGVGTRPDEAGEGTDLDGDPFPALQAEIVAQAKVE